MLVTVAVLIETVTVVLPDFPLRAAVIVTVLEVTPVTSPAVTVAAAVFEDDHAADEVTSFDDPSL